MPVGYRPSKEINIPAIYREDALFQGDEVVGRVLIKPNGDIITYPTDERSYNSVSFNALYFAS
jgi:hypothetical protein